MKKLKFMKGISSRRKFNRDEEILLLNQEIIDLKKRIENVEIKSFASESPVQPNKPDQLSKSLEAIRNIEIEVTEPHPEVDQLSKSLETIGNIPESQTQPVSKSDEVLNPLDVIKNIGNLKIAESDSTYEKEKPLEMEEEMEMEE